MSDEKTFQPETDGVLTVDIDGVQHEYSVSAGDEITIGWEP